VIGAYCRCVAETVAGFDDLVAKYKGDGLLIYSAIRRPKKMMLSELSERNWVGGARFKIRQHLSTRHRLLEIQ
jgi:hypothetical protein